MKRDAKIEQRGGKVKMLTPLEQIAERLEREQCRHSPEWLLMEEEKMTRLRLALFGSAPQ